jgi:hypothetical protein
MLECPSKTWFRRFLRSRESISREYGQLKRFTGYPEARWGFNVEVVAGETK